MSILKRLFSPSTAYDREIRDVRELDFVTVGDKLNFIRAAILRGAENPLVRETTVSVLQAYGAGSRDFRAQVAAVQQWFRDHFYYVNEHTETFQSAPYTLDKMYGDCDDATIATGAMLESITIPTKLVVVGQRTPKGMAYKHIFLKAGIPPKKPTEWLPVECTIPGADLSFDPLTYLQKLRDGNVL